MISPEIHFLDIAIIIGYVLGIIWAGFWFSKRASQNIDNYFLGGRSIPWYLLGISNASGMFDITGTMWMVMLLFVYGPKSLWIPWVWPTFNQVFMMVFLAAWLRRSGVLTGAEWLRTRFGAGRGLQLAHISVVMFALIATIAFIAVAFIGVGKFAAAMLPWNLEPNTYAMIVMSVTAVYVILGGMYSVVLTDVVQFTLLTISSVLVAAIAISSTATSEIFASTPEQWHSIGFGWRLDLDWDHLIPQVTQTIQSGGYEFFSLFLMMALLKGVLASIAGPTPGYDMQRILAARDERSASLMSAMVSPVLYVPRYLLIAGITVLALVHYSDELANHESPDFESILPYVIQNFIPIGLTGILLAGLLAAFMSTFDSTVNAGAAYVVNDVYKRYLFPKADERHLIRVSYIASAIIIVIGMAVGFYPKSINSQMQWIVGGLYGGYVAPNILKWIWWRLNGVGYFSGMVVGVGMSLALAAYQEPLLEWIKGTMPGVHEVIHAGPALYFVPLLIVTSGLASIVVSLLTEPDDLQTLKDFCRRVRPWGAWGPVAKLLVNEGGFEPNRDFKRDTINCAFGIIWQVALCAAPVYLVLRNFYAMGISLLVILVTTAFLKINWYDRLPPAMELHKPSEPTTTSRL